MARPATFRPGSGVGSCDVLFLIAYSEGARDHIPVFQEMQRRGYTCALGLLGPKPATEAVLAEAGISPFYWSNGEARYAATDSAEAGQVGEQPRGGATGLKRAVRAAFGATSMFEAVGELRSQLRRRREARRFFVPGRFRALVLETDTDPPVLCFAKTARQAGIPSVVIQSHLIPDEGSNLLAGRMMPTQHWRPVGKPLLERLAGATVAALWPHYVRRVDGLPVLPKRTPYMVLAAAAFTGLPSSMWFQIGGPANWYAVNGPQAVEVLAAEGIPREKLIPCGQPRVDRILQSVRHPTPGASRLAAGLGLPANSQVAVVATQPWQLPGILTQEQKVAEVRAVCEQLVACGEDVFVLVKPHPKETTQEYETVEVNNRVVVLPPESDIMAAITVCDVFLTKRSTTALFAVAAGKPVLTFNLHGIPMMDRFPTLGLSLPIRRAEDIPLLMRRLAEERGTSFLTPDRRRVLERYIRLDGGATAAVADLVERAIREGA